MNNELFLCLNSVLSGVVDSELGSLGCYEYNGTFYRVAWINIAKGDTNKLLLAYKLDRNGREWLRTRIPLETNSSDRVFEILPFFATRNNVNAFDPWRYFSIQLPFLPRVAREQLGILMRQKERRRKKEINQGVEYFPAFSLRCTIANSQSIRFIKFSRTHSSTVSRLGVRQGVKVYARWNESAIEFEEKSVGIKALDVGEAWMWIEWKDCFRWSANEERV